MGSRAAVIMFLLVSTPARADWLLPDEGLRLDTTAEIEMSSAKVGRPFAIAPDAWFGATDDLTFGIAESKYAATGFRGSAGSALCISGTTAGCPKVFNNLGIEAWGGLLHGRGPVTLLVGGGPYATNLASGLYDVKIGFKARVSAGRWSLAVMPSVFVAATHREDMPVTNPDMLYVPAAIGVKLGDATLGVGSGIKGPVSGFASKWVVPLGVSATLVAGPVAFGASFTYGALVGGQPEPPPPAPPTTGTELRVVQAWVSYAWAPSHHHAAVSREQVRAAQTAPAALPPLIAIAEEPRALAEPEQVRVELHDAAAVRIPAETIEAAAHEHAAEIHACSASYTQGGQVSIAFEIGATGTVTRSAVASTVLDVAVGDCVLRVVRAWQFPPPGVDAASGVYTASFEP